MRPRSLADWLTFSAVLAVCLVLAAGAYVLAQYAWNAVVDYRSPYAQFDVPGAGSGSEIATTTVLVIVDGLNDETSRKLDGLQQLRQYGTDLTLTAPQPSLSFPDWTTLISGVPPYVSGVTTNWFKGRVPVETLIDTAVRTDVPSVVVGPEEFDELYGASRATGHFLRSYPATFYASTELVDQAIALINRIEPRLAVIHLPDVDNAGHRSGADSQDYLETARKVDIDIGRLVKAVQAIGTVFIITADHGHIAAGGHGGWEKSVVEVPGIFFGTGVLLGQGNALQEDVAPTVAVIAGIPVPKLSKGDALDTVVGEATSVRLQPAWSQRLQFATRYIGYVTAPTGTTPNTEFAQYSHGATVTRAMNEADSIRLNYDRRTRVWIGLAGVALSLLALVILGLVSWRVLAAALVGAVAYYVVYNGLYFIVHGYQWSLSSINKETLLQSFFYFRMAEALFAGLIGAAVAGAVYPLFRARPQGAWGVYRVRWLTLGPATVLAIMATLGIQVAWFVWAWGIKPVWNLPDLKWGFKFDLDLLQATALGAAAVLTPLVTYLAGRYHPKTRHVPSDVSAAEDSGPDQPAEES